MAGENYIGSVISLISLSDIRYVGTLNSINPQDSTVGLKQVRSFGTEGRRGRPEEEILPSDNLFDYVVFRGSDIKDLQVFEAPKPAFPQPNIPQDPATMNFGYAPPMNTYNNNVYQQPPPPQQQQKPPQQQQQKPPQQQQQQRRRQPPPKQTNPQLPSQINERARQEKETLDELKAELEETNQPSINEAAIEELAKKVSELNTSEDKAKIISPPASTSRRNNNEYRGRGGRYNNNRQYNNKKEFSIPNSEFDFEASNAKFDKSEIKKEDDLEDNENEVEVPESEDFYDKKSSFFDNISCESKERSEQQNDTRRSRFQEERKLNMETFGQATVDQSRYRNNNYRGRGNNGYRNNNRGGYYHNNNNRSNYKQKPQQQHQDQEL